MATNNITSSKAPRRKTRRDRFTGPGSNLYAGDPILEHDNGERGRLAEIQAQPITGISAAKTEDLLSRAGIRARRSKPSL